MAEPQPSDIHEGAEQPSSLPANAEDRKAARALSALDTADDGSSGAGAKREVDLKALSEAMKTLELSQNPSSTSAGAKKKDTDAKKVDAPAKKLVKVDAADVALLVEHLDLSKTKATDLLRAHDADVTSAMTAWVRAA